MIFRKAKKLKKITNEGDEEKILGPARRNVHGPGERYREGVRQDLGLDF